MQDSGFGFDIGSHAHGLIISGALLLLGLLLSIIADCRDSRDIECADLMGDPKRRWTDPLLWFFPCIVYRMYLPKKKSTLKKKKKEPHYESPRKHPSPPSAKVPSLFSFESQEAAS